MRFQAHTAGIHVHVVPGKLCETSPDGAFDPLFTIAIGVYSAPRNGLDSTCRQEAKNDEIRPVSKGNISILQRLAVALWHGVCIYKCQQHEP